MHSLDIEKDPLHGTRESSELSDIVLRTYLNLPEGIRSDECFKQFQVEVDKRKSASEIDDEVPSKLVKYFKPSLLVAAWIFVVFFLLTVREKSIAKKLVSVQPQVETILPLNGTLKHAVRVTIEGHLESKSEVNCSNECLTICIKSSGSTIFSPECAVFLINSDEQTKQVVLFSVVSTINATENVSITFKHNLQQKGIPLILFVDFDVCNPVFGIILATLVLVFLYGLIIWEVVHRTFAALLSSALAIAALALVDDRPTMHEVIRWIDVETITLLFSMMILVSILSETGIFNYLAVFVYKITKGQVWALIHSLCILTTLISAFLDNVSTTLLISPVTITLCEVVNLNPVPVLMAIVIHANIGGTATPVGDPPNVIITSNPHVLSGGVSFVTFALHMGLGVILCMIITALYLRIEYRNITKLKIVGNYEFCNLEIEKEFIEWETALEDIVENEELEPLRSKIELKIEHLKNELKKSDNHDSYESKLKMMEKMYPIKDVALLIKSASVLFLVVTLFLVESVPELQRITLSWCALLGVFLILIISSRDDMDKILAKVEWSTLLFFAAMFIIMEIVDRLGLIKLIGDVTKNLILSVPQSFQLAIAIIIILWISGIVSAFVDSIPVTTMMVKVVVSIAENKSLGLPLQPLVWALAFGPCLGGNGTLVGASANVICASVAQQRGYKISFIEFFKLGFPIMLVTLATITVYLLIAHSIFEWH